MTPDPFTPPYDAQNQLNQITSPDSTTALYKYDGFGRRIEKNVNGAITRYVYDGQRLVLEYDGTNTFVARYSHGQQIDQPLAVQRAGLGFFYYHADQQGSITHLTDTSGNVANSYLYDSYGRQLNVIESVMQPFTYTGREQDSESGLYYYRARYYDPQTGRFLSEDPIGFNGSDHNLYRYVLNNPMNLNDPNGKAVPLLSPIFVGGGGGAAAGGGGTAAGLAATAAVGAAATAAVAALNELLNNNQEGGAEGQGDDEVFVNPDTGEIFDPRGQTDTETGTLVDPDQPQEAPDVPDGARGLCTFIYEKCLERCEPLCGKPKATCIAKCWAFFLTCQTILGQREKVSGTFFCF